MSTEEDSYNIKEKGEQRVRDKKRYRGKTNKHRNRAASRNGRLPIGNGKKVRCSFCYPVLSTRLEHAKEIERELKPNRYTR